MDGGPVAFRCGSRPPRRCPSGSGCDREDDHTCMEPPQESGHGYRWVRPHGAMGGGRGMDKTGSGRVPGGPGEEGKAQGDIEVRVGVDGALKIGQKWLYGPPPHGRQSPGSGSGRWQSRGCHVAFSSQRDWVPGWWVFPVHSILLLCASVCLPRVAARN